jgi:dihydropteroate synthase
VVDPGFGFGKTARHNLELLANLGRVGTLGLPLLVGLSRKNTLGQLTGRPVEERLAAGLAAAVLAVERGAHIVRTHDVGETLDALKMTSAVMRLE